MHPLTGAVWGLVADPRVARLNFCFRNVRKDRAKADVRYPQAPQAPRGANYNERRRIRCSQLVLANAPTRHALLHYKPQALKNIGAGFDPHSRHREVDS